jgi:predicted AAA+ superfamily ATPase
MHIKRQIYKKIKESKRSILLIGPRQTGKSTLIEQMPMDIKLNLADNETYFQHLNNPGLIKDITKNKQKIFIDEIQRIPSLLNSIQVLIDQDKSKKFFLTGSSARKLRRGQANLLPGRILNYEIGPLSFLELGEELFSLDKAMQRGLLPGIYTDESDEWKKVLKSYVASYLKEEVQAEALTRDIQGFSRFFAYTITQSGQHVDFSKYASQAMIERTTARRYFDILIDTLIVTQLEAFSVNKKTRLVQHPKFYCFDVGVLNSALGSWDLSNDRKGMLFEHFIFQQICSLQKSDDLEMRATTFRTENQCEVDFIIELNKEVFAIEVKASKNIGKSDLRGLKSFKEFYSKPHRSIILYQGEHPMVQDFVEILPWDLGLRQIFDKNTPSGFLQTNASFAPRK